MTTQFTRPSDAAVTTLALLAAGGDRAALGEFIRQTQADVWRFLAHLTDADAADDLTQDCFLRAMDALPTFRGDSPVRPWLITIARRCVADSFRRDAARPRVLRGEPDPDRGRASCEDAFSTVALQHMLATLDTDRREALVLTQLAGFTYAEAADIAGVPIGTIRSRVARARAHLVAEWGDATAGEAIDVAKESLAG